MEESVNDAPVVQWRMTGLIIRTDATFDEWLGVFEQAAATHRSINWALGDAIAFGQDRYEQFSQVVDDKYREQHREKAWVSARVPMERRRETCSWSLHREIASLDPEDQIRWLDAAEQGEWTVKTLKDEIAKERQAKERYPSNSAPNGEDRSARSDDDEGDELDERCGAETEPQERMNSSEPVAPAETVSATPEAASGDRAEEIRALIVAVRENAGNQGYLGALYGRIEDALEMVANAPLELVDDALSLRSPGWRISIAEEDDGWKVALKKTGQQGTFGMGSHLPSAIVEAVLGAALIDLESA